MMTAENYREPLSIIDSEREELIAALKPRKSDIVLDVATGPGYQAFALASSVKKVYGIDRSFPLVSNIMTLPSIWRVTTR